MVHCVNHGVVAHGGYFLLKALADNVIPDASRNLFQRQKSGKGAADAREMAMNMIFYIDTPGNFYYSPNTYCIRQ